MKGKGKGEKENSKSTMPTIGNDAGPRSGEVLVPAFAKLQGEYFEYYMRKYSIILGRYSKKKKSVVDLDLRSLAWGRGVSRNHARIYYDFTYKCFALEVIGRGGCIIKNVLYLPGSDPIKLNSQDLLQIGNVRFYFLLPSRSFFETLGVARQIAPPLLPPLMVVQPTVSNNERKGEESLGTGHAVHGLIVVDSNAREAEGSCGVFPGVSGVAGLIVPPVLPPLPVVSPSFMNVRMGEERKGHREESLVIGLGVCGVSGSVVEEFNANKAEGSSSMLSDTLAARQIVPSLLPPLVVVPPASSNDERKGKKRRSDREECLGVKLREGGANGLIEKFKSGDTEASSYVLSGGMEQSSLSNKKQELRSRSDREADNQEETNDVHVVKIDLPGINKEQIKLVIEEGKIWIQISEDAIEDEENISMCHCVEDNSSKFILPENAKINEIKASMENSVLTVTVPMGQIDKSEQPEVKSVEISG